MDESVKINKIAFIGGDMRQVRAINRISESGREVAVFGFNRDVIHKMDNSVVKAENIAAIPSDIRVFVLPLPYSMDGENIKAPFFDGTITISELLQAIPPESVLLAGRADARLEALAEVYGIKLIDYFKREELMVLNAVPTAEGAIQLALEETPHTLCGSECLVTGYGRIGKILAHMLSGLGAHVSVAARKLGDAAAADSFGYRGIQMWKLHDVVDRFDVIFNTVPYMIFDGDMLRRIRRETLLIDLASKPGGVDFDFAAREDIKVIQALSLPGKVAPDTAGDIIKDTILNILDELER